MGPRKMAEAQQRAIEHLIDDEKKKPEDISENTIIRALAEHAEEAFKRGRSALIVLFLSSLVLAIGFFNHRGSWLYTVNYNAEEAVNKRLKEPINSDHYPKGGQLAVIDAINRQSENDKPSYKRHLLHDVWDGDFKTVEVPALGVQFYVADLPLVGTVAVLLIISWFFVFRRRELGVVLEIRNKVGEAYERKEFHIVEYLYNALAMNQIFVTVKGVDDQTMELGKQDWGHPQFRIKLIAFIFVLATVGAVISPVFWGPLVLMKYITFYSFTVFVLIIFNFNLVKNVLMYYRSVIKSMIYPIDRNAFSEFIFLKKYSSFFLRLGLMCPVLILATVHCHDVYETYFQKGRSLYIPSDRLVNEFVIKTNLNQPDSTDYFRERLRLRLHSLERAHKTELGSFEFTPVIRDVFDILIKNKLVSRDIAPLIQLGKINLKWNRLANKWDTLELKCDTFELKNDLRDIFYTTCIEFYKEKLVPERINGEFEKMYRDTISNPELTANDSIDIVSKSVSLIEDSMNDAFLTDVTLYDHVNYYPIHYREMTQKEMRMFGMLKNYFYDMPFEINIVRTAIPAVLIFICFVMTVYILFSEDALQLQFEEVKEIYDKVKSNT